VGATLRGLNGDFDAGREMSDRAIEMAREVGGAEVLGMVLTERSALFFTAGHITECLACAREAVALIEGTSRRWSLVWANTRILNGVRFLARPRDVLAVVEALLPEAEAVGHVGAKLVCFIARITAEMALTGRLDTLDAGAEEVEHDYRDFGTWREIGPVWRARAAMDRGETEIAASLEGSSERLGNDSWLDVWWAVQFRAAASDDPAKARAILEANKHRIPVAGSCAPIGARVALYPLISGLIDLGDHAAAAALYPACTETLAMGLVGEWWLIDEAAGRAAEAAGDLETAEQHFTEALRIANEGGNVYSRAGVLLSHGRMLLTHGIDAERGRAMLEEALPMFEAGGRTRPAKECRELLGG
jgi:tetratricopeptide (TPR) repeat protein